MRTNTLPRKFVTLTEAAATLGISYSMLRKLVKQGKVSIIRIGRRILIPEAEVEKLIKELIEEGRW
jgi:excisionase family DNA binding protein